MLRAHLDMLNKCSYKIKKQTWSLDDFLKIIIKSSVCIYQVAVVAALRNG